MKKLLFLLTLLCVTLSDSKAQDYSFNLDSKLNSKDLYLFTNTKNDYIYLIEFEAYEKSSRKLTQIQKLDKVSKKETITELEEPILFQRKCLNAFYEDEKIYFLSLSSTTPLLEVSSVSVETNKYDGIPISINLKKKEKVITSYQKDGLIYIFTLEKKSSGLNLYLVSLSSKNVEKMSIELDKYDYGLVDLALKNNSSVSLIDYDNFNPVLAFINHLKIFVEKNTVVFYIKHNRVQLIKLYKFDLVEKKTRKLSFKSPSGGWNTVNATYIQGNLYRVLANRFVLKLDITNTETEESKAVEVTEKDEYPFDFQRSVAVEQNLNIIDDKQQILKKMGSRMAFIYPESYNDTTVIYLGGIANPGRYEQLISETLSIMENAANFYSGNYVFNMVNLRMSAGNVQENKLKYLLVETNLAEGLNAEIINPDFKKQVYPRLLKYRNSILDLEQQNATNVVSLQKIDGQYYAVCYIVETEKLILHAIEI